ncbi:MAG: acetyl-CoA carboxylase biotin carboxyl carrier protein [Planctomycetes bacterium]|nr:acetyl-CoA carboxylase biotin carboxyl carrier protein [Planctomycetota bacterium]
MSVDKIRELLELMNENELVELELEEGDFKVKLKKPGAGMMTMVPSAAPVAAPAPAAGAPAPAAAAAPAVDPNLVPIKSPIVGTFYRAPSPDSDPFASEGSQVNKDSVVCIIEAMKIMNEIKAGVSGTIEKILVENGEPIEYGQPLFLVRP